MIGSKKFQLSEGSLNLYKALSETIKNEKYQHIVNPCGEISLNVKGGYCLIGDIVPFFCKDLERVKEVAALAARFLIRTNLMDSIYSAETKRTNRIGVSMTGIHEFAWDKFGYGFRDLIDEDKSRDFWSFIAELRNHTVDAAYSYSDKLGVNKPHTVTTIKPSGSVSKLYGLTEGAHLPSKRFYLRNVQMQNNDPTLADYKAKGYPVRELQNYPNVSIVGFPTRPLISTLGMGDKLVTANEATPEEQYKWLMLLEKYWIGEGNNQISYTMFVDTKKYSLDEFKKTLFNYQSKIRCCSVMPLVNQDECAYEYLPNEEITEAEFHAIERHIKAKALETVKDEELMCAGGACPL